MIKLPPNFKKNIFYILCSSYKTDLHKFHEIYFFSFAQVIICYEKKITLNSFLQSRLQ